jgi:hypothetical protein
MNVRLLFPSYNSVQHKNLRGFPGGHILLNFKTEDFFSFKASCCQGTVEGDGFFLTKQINAERCSALQIFLLLQKVIKIGSVVDTDPVDPELIGLLISHPDP